MDILVCGETSVALQPNPNTAQYFFLYISKSKHLCVENHINISRLNYYLICM